MTRAGAHRVGVSVLFFANGFAFGTWVAHLPLFKSRLALSDGALGFALLAASAASLVAMPLVGALVARVGSRWPCGAASVLATAALGLPFLATSYPAFAACAALLGAVFSSMDVTMNAQAVAVERRYGRQILSSFHAVFSIGGLLGSALSAILIARDVPFAAQGIGVALVGVLLALGAALSLANEAPERAARTAERGARDGETRRMLGVLGAIALFGLVGEGAMADWSGIYLRTSLGVAAAASAFGFGAFSVAMAAGRIGGDALVARLGPVRVLGYGALLAAVALAAAIGVHDASVAFVAFVAVGLGLANVVPIAFSAVGRMASLPPGVGIATVSTIGYAGFLVGPPAIGLTSDAIGIRLALLLVVACVAAIIPLARLATARSQRSLRNVT